MSEVSIVEATVTENKDDDDKNTFAQTICVLDGSESDSDDNDFEVAQFLRKVNEAHGSLLGENWGRVSNAWDLPFPVCMAVTDL